MNSAGTVTASTGMDSSAATCTGSGVTCTPAQLAYDDVVRTWVPQYVAAFPNAQASIACVPVAGASCAASPTSPHGYDITLTWDQKLVAISKTTAGSQTQSVTIVMHVQP
jgi:hypothetical protein